VEISAGAGAGTGPIITVPGADHLLRLRAPARLARVTAEAVPG